jgi:dUTP pyrophosphatase
MKNMDLIFVKRLCREALVPRRATSGSAGFDLYISQRVVLKAGEISIIPLGICIQFPKGYFGKIESRSGLASRGLFVVGGVIDCDYTGELKAVIINYSRNDYEFNIGDAVAQLIVQPYCFTPMIVDMLELDAFKSERGDGGFGSTGNDGRPLVD